MEYPTKAPYQAPQPASRVERPKQSLEAWVKDLCTVKESFDGAMDQCFDGFVSKEVEGYRTLFACPVCDRSKRELAGYQSIPTAKKWAYGYKVYTEVEMAQRKANRRDVVDSLRRGAAKIPQEVESWANSEDPF